MINDALEHSVTVCFAVSAHRLALLSESKHVKMHLLLLLLCRSLE
jgi:hypothetical protein